MVLKMKIEIRKSEVPFYLSYICLYISLFMGDLYRTDSIADIAKIIRLFSYVLIVISVFQYKFTIKEFFKLFIFFILTLTYGISTSDFYWSILVLLIYGSKQIKVNNIFTVSTIIIKCGIVLVLFFCLIGILPDAITTRDSTTAAYDYIRHSLGFFHSNVLPLLLLYLEIYYVFMRKGKVSSTKIMVFTILAIFLYFICNSRNAFILSCFLSCFTVIENHTKSNNSISRLLYSATKFSVPIMAAFSYSMMFLLLKGGVWNAIDAFFSGRFRLAIFKMRRVGLHLINIMSNEEFITDNVSYVNGKVLNTVILDNGYLYIMLRYGILIVIFYITVSYLLAKKTKGNSCLLGTLIVVFFANFVDNDLVDYSFLPFILWAFNDLSVERIINKAKSRINRKSMMSLGRNTI